MPSNRLKLRFGSREAWLVPGRYLIGRSAGCHVVLDDHLVSRRHAMLVVGEDGSAEVQDLGSVNGTFVDGQRLGREPHLLHPGSRVVVGGSKLQLELATELPPFREKFDTLTADASRSSLPAKLTPTEVIPDVGAIARTVSLELEANPAGVDDPSTERADPLALFTPIFHEALRDGRAEDAERLVAAYLRNFLAAARAGTTPDRFSLERVLRLAGELASAGRPGWFDFVVELLDTLRLPPPSEEIVQLLERSARVAHPDPVKLDRWLRTLRSRMSALRLGDLRNVDRLDVVLTVLVKRAP